MIRVDRNYFRPSEVDLLIGDATKARTKLGWTTEYDLEGLINDMIVSDIKLMKRENHLKNGGFRILKLFRITLCALCAILVPFVVKKFIRNIHQG
jgi:GDPmannose 4,6-dehydratase